MSDFNRFFVTDGAFKKLKTEGETGGGMSVHHAPSSSCPTPARRRHRTTFTQVSLSGQRVFGFFICVHVISIFRNSFKSWRPPLPSPTTPTSTAARSWPGAPSSTRPGFRSGGQLVILSRRICHNTEISKRRIPLLNLRRMLARNYL